MRKTFIKVILIGAMLCVAGCKNADNKMEETTSETTKNQETTKKQEEVTTNMYVTEVGYAVKQEGVEYGEVTAIEYASTTTGTTRKANIILPAGYSEDKEYPVLYLLHGIGGDHNEWLQGSPAIVIGNLIAKGEAEEMIVVMPNVRTRVNDAANPSDMYTLGHFEAFDNFINDLQNDLMPYIEENYSVAAGRENTAIAGLSMGGRESLYIGLTMQETFGYIGAFCPAPGVLPYNVEGGLIESANFKVAEEYETLIMIVAGKSDSVVGTWPATYDQTLTDNGTEHIYYEIAGGHDFSVWKHGLYNFAKRIFQD